MYIGYKNKKLEKICSEKTPASRFLPHNITIERLFRRLRDLAAFDTMADVPTEPPFRLHKWKGKRLAQWTVDIQGLYRIHFVPTGDYDKDSNGYPVLGTVNSIEIVDIGDYH